MGKLNSSRAHPLDLIVETMKAALGSFDLCCSLSEENWSPGFFLVVGGEITFN